MPAATPDDRRAIVVLARQALDAAVRRQPPPAAPGTPPFDELAGAFVTLHQRGELRGCIGQIEPTQPLGAVIVHCAAAAALEDPRFPPVTTAELPLLSVEVSVLTPLEPVTDIERIEVGRHGLVVAHGGRRGLLLPQVPGEWGWSRDEFLSQTCRKAGLAADDWRHGASIFTFETRIYQEDPREARAACPSCGQSMRSMTLDAHYHGQVTIDACEPCHGFWFDGLEHLQLAPSAVLHLFDVINGATAERHPLADRLPCPRCRLTLVRTDDRQKATTFRYWRCPREHGRFITFVDFLREKDFIRPLDPSQVAELRARQHSVKCSNCGAVIDLTRDTACAYCHTPLLMIDFDQVGRMVAELRARAAGTGRPAAAAPAPAPPVFDPEDWKRFADGGPVEKGLAAVLSWLSRSGDR